MSKAPWLLLAGLGLGAYFLGRKEGEDASPPSDVPIPPIPSLDAATAGNYSDAWNEALDEYDVDVYPPEAVPLVGQLLPPPPIDGISVTDQCRTVAVGAGWWAMAAAQAKRGSSSTPTAVANRILDRLAPSCRSSQAAGAKAFRAELKDWLAEYGLATRNMDPGWSFRSSWAPPSRSRVKYTNDALAAYMRKLGLSSRNRSPYRTADIYGFQGIDPGESTSYDPTSDLVNLWNRLDFSFDDDDDSSISYTDDGFRSSFKRNG